MKKKSLLIIGGGASGLMAASELSKRFEITLLEAAPRLGGRINSIEIQNDILEAGAEFIHGRLPLTFKLLKEANIKAVPAEGKFYRVEDGRFVEQKEMLKGWSKLLSKMKAIKKDLTMSQFLDEYYAGEKNLAFRKFVSAYTEGFDIADPCRASVKSLYLEWSAEEGINYRIPSGYFSLLNYLKEKASCKILTGKKVHKIIWKENNITVITSGGEEFQAEKILITVPVSMLQQSSGENSIAFDPPLRQYVDAANNIGFGSVLKIIIRFKEAFWKKDAAFFISGEKYFPTWWTQLPADLPILTGWFGGPEAKSLSVESKDELIVKALHSLSNIFSKSFDELQQDLVYAEVFNWQNEPLFTGAYSYDTIYSTIAKKVLNLPVANTIFFAGEALYSGNYPGTVEAALQSAKDVAKRIRL